MLALGFGTAAMGFTMIPIINLVVMPAAVAGASKLWVKELKASQ
jgi:CysZ protein